MSTHSKFNQNLQAKKKKKNSLEMRKRFLITNARDRYSSFVLRLGLMSLICNDSSVIKKVIYGKVLSITNIACVTART